MSYLEYFVLYGMVFIYFRIDDIDKVFVMVDKVIFYLLMVLFYDSEIYWFKVKVLLKVDWLKEVREVFDMLWVMYNDYCIDEKIIWCVDLEKLVVEIIVKEGDF